MTKHKLTTTFVLAAASLLLLVVSIPANAVAADGPTVIATIGLGPDQAATGFALAINQRTNLTYVTPGLEPLGCESRIVSVIDNRTRKVLPPITVGLSPFGVAVNQKTNKIYVANIGGALCTQEQSKTVSVIDGSTNLVRKTITLDDIGPAFVAVNENTNKIYVTLSGGCCADGHRVAVIDGATDAVTRYVDVDPNPFVIAVNPMTNLVYVTHAGDEITVIDGSTDTVRATFAIGSEARDIAFDRDGKLVYIVARNINGLAVVDARTNTVVQTIAVGLRPHGVAFNPDNGRIYVTNRGRCDSTPGTVSVVDSETRTVVATVPVGTCPRFLDIDPDSGLVYVPNAFTSRSVSVLRDED